MTPNIIPSASKPVRFLIAGTGAIVEKLEKTWQQFDSMGVELHAADIRDDAAGRSVLPESVHFYNWKNPNQLRDLADAAHDEPFDFVYLSTFPDVHIFTALRLDFLAHNFIFPKPVDSNFPSMATLHSEYMTDRAVNIATRSSVHDHYRNKPLTHYLRAHIGQLHSRNGFFKNIKIYITEHKSIQMEFQRRKSLECGMILDLCPHALSVAYEIVPEKLTWNDDEGNTFRRTARSFQVVSCIRARDNLSILHSPNSETFAAIHFRGLEDIEFIPRGAEDVADRLKDRPFDLLVVVGKGVSLGGREEGRDLKAIEMEFDGQTVRGNFDTSALAGVTDKELQQEAERHIDPRHRGLNLPLMQLADSNFAFDNGSENQLVTPFQHYEEAFGIAALLDKAARDQSSQDLLHYRPGSGVPDIVNRCVSRGLDRRWALDEDSLGRLIFGELPGDPIP